jgi:transposase
MPLGYEVFEGNRSDKTTVQEMVETMESRYGKADRIWVMDRGMASEDNLTFLQEGGRRYILGTPKSDLKPFERELVNGSWETIREGLEVQLCPSPEGEETYILCRSQDRGEKDRGILERFEKRIEAGLEKIKTGCEKRNCKVNGIERRIGRLLGQNSRAAGLFDVTVDQTAKCGARITWTKREDRRQWAQLTHGCYLLRTNVIDWSPQDLWHAYMQLHEAETAFRIHKSDLSIRPIWHQKPHRVQAHILVCFLAYVLWKTLAQLCKRGGLGDEPRRVLNTLKELRVVDVILPTKKGNKIRKRCIQQPTDHQKILLDHLGLRLPKTVEITKM